MDDLGALELLERDPRPTFVIEKNVIPVNYLFRNKALQNHPYFSLRIDESSDEAACFEKWLTTDGFDDTAATSWEFTGTIWTAFVIDNKVVVSAPVYSDISLTGGDPVKMGKKTLGQGHSANIKVNGVHSTGGHAHNLDDTIFDMSHLSDEEVARREAEMNHALMLRTREADKTSEMLGALHTVLELSSVGVFHFDSNGKLLQANDAWFALSGHPKHVEEHENYTFMNVVYEEDAPLVMSMWTELSQGKPVTFEMRWRFSGKPEDLTAEQKEMKGQWVLSACVPIMEDGVVKSIAGNTTNIAPQKQQQNDALQRAAAQQRFSTFAKLTPVAIYVLNKETKLDYCNANFFKLTGLPVTAAEDVEWAGIVFPDDMPMVQSALQEVLANKVSHTAQFRLNRRWTSQDGIESQAWVMATTNCDVDEHGELKAINGCMVDITQLKWAENAEKLRTEAVLEQKRQQEFFLDEISHELRNPMSAVLQCADSVNDILEDMSSHITSVEGSNSKPELQNCINECLDAIRTIIACSIHQKNLADDILTLSKLDSRLVVVSPAPTSPQIILENAVHMYALEAKNSDVALVSHNDPSYLEMEIDTVMIDSSRVTQILINLLTNAIKFTRAEAERKITVTLGASTERPTELPGQVRFMPREANKDEFLEKPELGLGKKMYLWISVQDTGCGLDQTQQDKLFQRFSQAFTPRTHTKYGGSGLGLFISKSLAELQGGAIGVASKIKVGSTFGFYIATRLVQTKNLAKQPRTLRSATATATEDGRYHILLVEDNIVNQKVLAQQLKKAGCIVHVASHGVEALDFLKKTKHWKGQEKSDLQISVVLMDVEMPVMGGLECTRKIREFEDEGKITTHLPIMAVSANARTQQISETRTAGMDDAITKPFRVPELLVKIERLVGEE